MLHAPGAELAGGIERSDHPDLGSDLGTLAGDAPLGLTAAADAAALFAASDVVIDFSAPAAVLVHAPLAATHRTALVVGTTGLADEHRAALADAARVIAVVVAANMSVGVNLLLGLTRRVAEVLGPDYDIEIVEMHHRHKVDAPSGTALTLGEAAAAGRGVALADAGVRVRDGHTGSRPAGRHRLCHAARRRRRGRAYGDLRRRRRTAGTDSQSRVTLCLRRGCGARRPVVRRPPPGLYTMRDVLGLN